MQPVIDSLKNIHLFSLMLGGIFLIAGLITKLFPPKKINHFYGYRTRRSMKSQANWDFAQHYAPREMLRGGWIIIAFALSGMVFPSSILTDTIAGLILMTSIFVALIVRTELAIKRYESSPRNN